MLKEGHGPEEERKRRGQKVEDGGEGWCKGVWEKDRVVKCGNTQNENSALSWAVITEQAEEKKLQSPMIWLSFIPTTMSRKIHMILFITFHG